MNREEKNEYEQSVNDHQRAMNDPEYAKQINERYKAHERAQIDDAKKHIRKFTIKTELAKQLREALKQSLDEYKPLEKQTFELREEQRQLEHKLKLLRAKIASNEAKLRLIRLIARDQKNAWQTEVDAQTRDALRDVRQISHGRSALYELFGDCFCVGDLNMPEPVSGDYDA